MLIMQLFYKFEEVVVDEALVTLRYLLLLFFVNVNLSPEYPSPPIGVDPPENAAFKAPAGI